MAQRFNILIADRELEYTHAKYKAIPGDSAQRVWMIADATLEKATALYYGK